MDRAKTTEHETTGILMWSKVHHTLSRPALCLNPCFSSFRGGIERETTGILMWSKVYTLQTPTGKEVAIALVDTQVQICYPRYRYLLVHIA